MLPGGVEAPPACLRRQVDTCIKTHGIVTHPALGTRVYAYEVRRGGGDECGGGGRLGGVGVAQEAGGI